MSDSSAAAEKKLKALSRERADLLQLLRDEDSKKKQGIPRHPRMDRDRWPASWAQQRLWFVDQLGSGGTAYNTGLSFRLRGPLDHRALRKALDEIMQRHEALRTSFVGVEGEAAQEIAVVGHFPLVEIDLTRYEVTEREARLRLEKMDEAHKPFDLGAAPLIRARLLRLGAEDHVLLISVHHIVCDGWSLGILAGELGELYSAYREKGSGRLPALPIQYADYALWQHQSLKGDVLDRQLGHWKAQLQGLMPQIDLPTDRPRPEAQSFRGDTVVISFDAELCANLTAFAKKQEITLFMLLYAAWAILLSRLSGQSDIAVGTPVAGRRRPELERLIGLFANTLVLRVQVRGDLRVADFLAQVKEATLSALENQDTPFEEVVEAMKPERSLSRNPLFQVMFAFQNTPRILPELLGLIVSEEEDAYQSSIFDLFLSIEEQGERLVARMNYATDLFDRDTIERWMNHLSVLLSELANRAESEIRDLKVLSHYEDHRIAELFNTTDCQYQEEALVHQLFEEQVERTPDAVALVYGNRSLTYSELNERGNQLARYLIDKGVGPDKTVVLCLERGLTMVVALLGVLKAGGAYVPLDPAYPVERLQYMIEDSDPHLVLTEESLKASLLFTVEVVSINSFNDEIYHRDGRNVDPCGLGLTARNLAYVIYTSGSTGKPKGVMIEHRAVVNFLTVMQSNPGISSADCLLALTTVSFDISGLEIYLPLISGAKIVLAGREAASDPQQILAMLDQFSVTVLQATPATWQMLLNAGWSGRSTMKAICGGEALTVDLSTKLIRRVETLWNLYGPTETTIWSCVRQIEAPYTRSSLESIGRPIGNTRIYILDEYLTPVPIGAAGEMYIAGAGVARGYWRRPDLTSVRFTACPFRSEHETRMYRTGDLARWRPDGTIEYLGRNDQQVKIRGFRVELGEIETQLARHAAVREAVVAALADPQGERHLVAYITLRGVEAPRVEDLRIHLKMTLPEYMVPRAFVTIERWPLTPSGKLDRGALPLPMREAYAKQEYEPANDHVEEAMVRIWQDILRLETIGVRDNFFELGGHSLTAMKLIARVSEQFSVRLSALAVFQNQTVQQLAEAVRLRQVASGKPVLGDGSEYEEGAV